MTIDDRSQREPLLVQKIPFLGISHRTKGEQGVGFGIFLALSLGIETLASLPSSSYGIWGLSLALSIWSLWRRYSLRVIKLELSVFLSQFIFQIASSVTFFLFNQILLTLVSLLLLWCSTLLTALLFWKKERLSSLLLFLPLLWVFYLVGLNMVICMRLTC